MAFGYFLGAVMGVLIKFYVWAFTRGWPVGLGMLAYGVVRAMGLPEAVSWAAFVVVAVAGYVWKLRERIWPEKFRQQPPQQGWQGWQEGGPPGGPPSCPPPPGSPPRV